MIVGIGSDLIDIRRIEKTLMRYGERFMSRVFTDQERLTCNKRQLCAACYAKRFAAKEACAKALGSGIARGVWWRDLAVVNLASGKPTMEIKGGAAKLLTNILPDGARPHIHLSMTDDFPWAQAFVIIEAEIITNLPSQQGAAYP